MHERVAAGDELSLRNAAIAIGVDRLDAIGLGPAFRRARARSPTTPVLLRDFVAQSLELRAGDVVVVVCVRAFERSAACSLDLPRLDHVVAVGVEPLEDAPRSRLSARDGVEQRQPDGEATGEQPTAVY